jgi:hypothetical protein
LQSAAGCRTIPRAAGPASRIAAVRAHGVGRLRNSAQDGAGSPGLFYPVRAWIARVGGVPLARVRFFDPGILFFDLQVTYLDPQVTFLDLQVTFLDLQVAFLDLQVAFLDLQVTFLDLQVAYLDLQVAYLDPQVTYLDLQVTYLDLQVALLDLQVALLDLQVTFLDPQVAFPDPRIPVFDPRVIFSDPRVLLIALSAHERQRRRGGRPVSRRGQPARGTSWSWRADSGDFGPGWPRGRGAGLRCAPDS